MKSYKHFGYVRVTAIFILAAVCTMSRLNADEAASAAQRFDEAADQAGNARTAAEISAKFSILAGSPANATALVTGLRDGRTVTLTTTIDNQAVPIEFQPVVGQLGYGNTFIALALAEESLAKAGITQPTADQLVAALNGGVVTGGDGGAIALTGVLTLRAAGNGWGDIAQSLGVKLGPVMQNLQAAHRQIGPPDKPAVTDKPDAVPPKAEPVDRPNTAGRPLSAGNPANSHRPMPPPPPPAQAARPGKP
jgi:hypothetical protein